METKAIVATKLTNGTPIALECESDECGNLWIADTTRNRQTLGIPGLNAKGVFGTCFVPYFGDEESAKERALSYIIGEGERFTVFSRWTAHL